jgi:RHS repeat-associated protein
MVRKSYSTFLVVTGLIALSLWQSASYALSAPEPLTQTRFTYQASGAVASETLSWADGQDHADQVNQVSQLSQQQLLTNPQLNPLCTQHLPNKLAAVKAYLICDIQTNALGQSQESYTDSRNRELLASVDIAGHVTAYSYDSLRRKTSISQAGHTTLISYLGPQQGNNHTPYHAVTVTHDDGFAQRTLSDAIGRKVAEQINTCADGSTTYDFNEVGDISQAKPKKLLADCTTVRALLPAAHPFRTVRVYSYVDFDRAVHSQVQSSTDVLGGITRNEYNGLGQLVGQITNAQLTSNGSSTTSWRGIFTWRDQVDNLVVSYSATVGYTEANQLAINSISTTAPVKISYLNTSDEPIKTQLLQAVALQQAGIDLRTLTESAVSQSALLSYLTGPGHPTGWIETTQYDGLLQKQQQQNSLQQSTYQYGPRGLTQQVTIKSVTDLTSSIADSTRYQYNKFQYNLLGKLQQNTLQQQRLTANGQTTLVASHTSAQHHYNSLGQLSQLTDQLGNQTLLASNPHTMISAQADVYANITYCRQYNDQGQPLYSWHVVAAQTSPATTAACDSRPPYYDKLWRYYQPGDKGSAGNPQPVGALQSVAFDTRNSNHPKADTIRYSYYLDGALKRKLYSDGTALTYQYNTLRQVAQVSTYQDVSAGSPGILQSQHQYHYGGGAAHQLLYVQNASGSLTVSYVYNAVGQLMSTSRTDLKDNLTVTTDKAYSGYGLLHISSLCQGAQCSVSNPHAQQNLTYTYQGGQLKQLQVAHPQISTEPDYRTFNYLKIYRYDDLNRLVGVQITDATKTAVITSTSYVFDINNNIKSVAKDGQVTSYRYDAIDQLTRSLSGHYPCQYNVAGNLTQDPDGTRYSYNYANQLTEVITPQGQTTYYRYYPDGELQHEFQPAGQPSATTPDFNTVSAGFTFYYSQGQVVQVSDKQGNWTSYLGGLTREVVTYHHQTGICQTQFYAYQGKTPSGWLNSSNQANWQRRSPYGQLEKTYASSGSSVGNQPGLLTLANHPHVIGFNGNYQDSVTGLVFMGARVYSPSLKRFLQRDSADVANRYAYAQANPIANWDPSGHNSEALNWFLNVAGIAGSLIGICSGILSGDIPGAVAGVLGLVGASLSVAGSAENLEGHTAIARDLNYAATAFGLASMALGVGAAMNNGTVFTEEDYAAVNYRPNEIRDPEALWAYYKKAHQITGENLDIERDKFLELFETVKIERYENDLDLAFSNSRGSTNYDNSPDYSETKKILLSHNIQNNLNALENIETFFDTGEPEGDEPEWFRDVKSVKDNAQHLTSELIKKIIGPDPTGTYIGRSTGGIGYSRYEFKPKATSALLL